MPTAIACSYNAVNGVPSCASSFLLQTVLRDAWNFSGYVTSDSGAVADIYSQHHYLNSTAAEGVAYAIKAGCDIDSSLQNGYFNSGSPYVWYARDATLLSACDCAVSTAVEREGHDRTALGLPGAQQQLLEAVVAVGTKRSRRVVLVTLSGGPVALDWAKTAAGVGAIIHAFYPGGCAAHHIRAQCL